MGLLDAILSLLKPLDPFEHVFDLQVLVNLRGKLTCPVRVTFLLGAFKDDGPHVDKVKDFLQGDVIIELELEDGSLYHQLPNLNLGGQYVLVLRDAFPGFQLSLRVLLKLIICEE